MKKRLRPPPCLVLRLCCRDCGRGSHRCRFRGGLHTLLHKESLNGRTPRGVLSSVPREVFPLGVQGLPGEVKSRAITDTG